jgi:hypothetical protein
MKVTNINSILSIVIISLQNSFSFKQVNKVAISILSKFQISKNKFDSVDPFDVIKVSSKQRKFNNFTANNKSNNIESTTIKNYTDSNILSTIPISFSEIISFKAPYNESITIDDESFVLLSLKEYKLFCQFVIPRLGLLCFLLNTALLLPSLPILEFQLHVSIFPFLLTGPVLFISPYILLLLWETNIINSDTLDSLLLRYLTMRL